MKKIVCLLLSLVLMLSILSACKPEEHVHTFSEAWQSDETDHWHQATCEHADQIKDKAPHEDLDENDLCDVCGYAMNHEHTHSTQWSFNKDEHYHAPTCGCNANDKKYQKDNAPHVDKDNDAICDVCTYDYDHTHTYDEKVWVKADEQYHWHVPTCGHDVDGADKEEHKDEDNNGLCDGCEWNFDHEHTFEEEFTVDGDYHWKKPTCGHEILGQKNPHRDADGDGKCDTCQNAAEHYHDIDWDNWTSDKENHWHAAKEDCADCKDADGNPVIADFGAHIEWKEDGICDTCEHIVFHLYKVDVTLPDFSKIVNEKGEVILDKEGKPMELPFIVKEGESLEFYITIPNTHRLEGITGAEVDMVNYIRLDNEDGTTTYLYKISITPESDVTINATISKLSSVEVIHEGTVNMPAESWKYSYGSVTFTIPEDGKYTIFCVADRWFRFQNPVTGVYEAEMQFDATAGEVTLPTQYWADKAVPGGVDLEYVVVKTDSTFVLPYLEGEGYTMPAKVNVTFKFTLPEPGLYLFTTQVGELVWVTPDNADGTVEPQYFECTTAGQVFEHTCKLMTDSMATYEFDWKIVKLESKGSVGVGDNSVQVDVDSMVGYTFTAPYTGEYEFGWSGDMTVKAYRKLTANSTNKNMYTHTGGFMMAGETVQLYTQVDLYAENVPTEDFTGTLSIRFLGYTPDMDYNGNPTLHPGASWKFTAESDGNYSFSVPEGAYVSLNGGAWTAGKASIALKKDESVTVVVKSDNGSAVKVTIDEVYFEHVVAVGKQEYSFYPNVEYTVTLSGGVSPAELKPYVLSWTDTNLVVKYNDAEVTSGTELEYVPGTELIIVYSGTAENKIELTLTENYEAPAADKTAVLGTNSVALPGGPFGREMIFVVTQSGTYVVKLAEDETNGVLSINGETVEGTYEIELKQADTLTINVFTANGISDTVDFVIEKKQTSSETDILDLLTGNYVYTEEGFNLYEIQFITYADYPGYANMTLVDNYKGDMVDLNGEYGIEVMDGVMTIYNSAYEVVESFSFEARDGELVLIIGAFEYPLTSANEEEPKDNVLVEGENNLQIPAGMDGVDYTFTATEAGTYVLNLAAGEENAWVNYGNESNVTLPLTVTLAAGDTITFNISTYSMEADEINLTWTKEGSNEPSGNGNTLSVGENSIAVPAYGETKVTFTAAEAGSYLLTFAAGEVNGDVGVEGNYGFESVMGTNGYTVDLDVGESVELIVVTVDWAEDTIDLVLTKTAAEIHKHTYSEEWSFDDWAHWHNATCEHTTEQEQYEGHVDEDQDGNCDVCTHHYHDFAEISVILPEGAQLQDWTGAEVSNPYKVEIGEWPYLYIAVPAVYENVIITGCEYDGTMGVENGYAMYQLYVGFVEADMVITVTADAPEVLVEEVAKDNVVTFDYTNVEYYDIAYVPVTFTATEPGIYVFSSSDMYLVLDPEDSPKDSLTVEVTEAGDVNLFAGVMYTGYNETEYTYSVFMLESYELPVLTGAGVTMSANVEMLVTLTFPDAGLYEINTSADYWVINGERFYSGDFYMAEAGEELTAGVYYAEYEPGKDTFTFDWDVRLVKVLDGMNVGANPVYPAVDEFYGFTVAAPLEGAYRFYLVDGSNAVLYYFEDGYMMPVNEFHVEALLKAGQTVTLYVKAESEVEAAAIEDVLYVEFLGNMPIANEETGMYPALTNTVNAWVCEADGLYNITAEGGKLTVDGINWVDQLVEYELKAGDVLYYMVQSNVQTSVVSVDIEKQLFEGELELGEGSLTLRPGIEYTVDVNADRFALSWDPELNLTVVNAWGEAVKNGATTSGALYITYEGEAAAEIKFTVEDMSPVETQMAAEGSHSLTLTPGREYIVSLPYWYDNVGDLSYILTWEQADVSATHGWYNTQIVSGEKWSDWSNSITIINNGDEEVTVSFTLTKPVEDEGGNEGGSNAGTELVVGENVITDEGALWNDYPVTFTATMAGTYTFTADNDMMNGSSPLPNPYTVTLAAGETISIDLYSFGQTVTITITME